MSLNICIPQYENLKDLIDSCTYFYEKNKERVNNEYVRERRYKLSTFIEKFHKESGTLTPNVKQKVMILRQEVPILLMTAHQPNLFAYSGVMRKATLIFTLGRELERRLSTPVVTFFGIADQDFTDDRWVKSSLLPAITRRCGTLTLSVDLPEKTMLNSVPKLSINKINNLKNEIEIWLHNATYTINNFCKEKGISNWDSIKSLIHHNFEMFWEIVKEAHSRAITYSDFNAFIMSKIINEIWGYDTLFSRFSDCQGVFSHEYNFLLSRFKDYSASLKEVSESSPKMALSKGVSNKESKFLPFWYHCDCGSKARLSLLNRNDSLIGHGFCINCKKEYNVNMGKINSPDVSGSTSNISPRAIPMILIFSRGLGLSCYAGGIGGMEYLNEARYVANKIDIALPPYVIWRPHDKYLGIGQLESLLEYKRITGNYEFYKWEEEVDNIKSRINNIYNEIHPLELKKDKMIDKLKKGEIDMKIFRTELKNLINMIGIIKNTSELSILQRDLNMLKNVPVVLTLMPSIIDYAINVGLNETSKKWIDFLISNGSFTSEVYLKSYLENIKDIEKIFIKL